MQSTIVHNYLGGGNQFIHSDGCSSHRNRTHSVSKKKTYSMAEQCLLIFFSRIGVLNGNSGSTGCARGGREEYAIILSFFLKYLWLLFLQRYRPVFTLSASFLLYLQGMASDLCPLLSRTVPYTYVINPCSQGDKTHGEELSTDALLFLCLAHTPCCICSYRSPRYALARYMHTKQAHLSGFRPAQAPH